MLICLFKLEDDGPTIVNMVSDKNVEFDENVTEKFMFSGSITYSLVFQGMVTFDDLSSELYGPFPFAFSSGFVQYAFSFLVEDKTMKDQRMKKKTLGLVLMLVPEMLSKIDDFREELAKTLIYKFHSVKKIQDVDEKFLSGIIQSYNKVLADLMESKQAELLSSQLLDFIQQKPKPLKKDPLNLAIIYPKAFIYIVKRYYNSLLSSIPYVTTSYSKEEAIIRTKQHNISIKLVSNIDEEFINNQKALILVIDVASKKYETFYKLLSNLKKELKIAVVISLPNDIEKASHQYAKFFTGLQRYISGMPFFSASFTSPHDFKTKMLEALFWALSE
ncbi:MAG: hypothetical protein H7647_00855 [Candidatus Heimdallarchaeota archaeon]|nr:hypothetical protein [Candidatus Heimdallarchaeota archaeon]MCK4252983.1 hypothetical protein [Candidatus Heimdallarchaeota archaeon]